MPFQLIIVFRILLGIIAAIALIVGLYYAGFAPKKLTPVGMREDRAQRAEDYEYYEDGESVAESDQESAENTVDALFGDSKEAIEEPAEKEGSTSFAAMKERLDSIGVDSDNEEEFKEEEASEKKKKRKKRRKGRQR